MELISFSQLDAAAKRAEILNDTANKLIGQNILLRSALRQAIEYADELMEQGWGKKHQPGESALFDSLVARLNDE